MRRRLSPGNFLVLGVTVLLLAYTPWSTQSSLAASTIEGSAERYETSTPDLSAFTECPSADYWLSSQAEVDAFPSNCDEITGDLRIEAAGGASITDISTLAGITTVGGNLSIVGTDLTGVDGLSALTSIGGDLLIVGTNLSNADGLSALASIGGDLLVQANAALIDLGGLGALTSVGDDININGNNALSDLGFASLSSLNGDLTIQSNGALAGLDGLSALTSVDGDLSINRNGSLTSLGGLSGLTAVGGDLVIFRNDALTGLAGFSALASVGGDLSINDNNVLTSVGAFTSLGAVGGSLQIVLNDVLTNVNGLFGIATVGGALRIDRNDALRNINGLSSLSVVGGNLTVTDNDALVDVDGLQEVTSVGGSLNVRDNDALTGCGCGLYSCVSGTCFGGSITMMDNSPDGDCNNDGADLEANACPAVGIEDDEVSSNVPTLFQLYPAYPNPFNPSTTMRYDVPVAGSVRLSVFDALGRLVEVLSARHVTPGSYEVSWDAGTAPTGVYYVRMDADAFVTTRQVLLVR